MDAIRISSKVTYLVKRLVPSCWLVFTAFIVFIALYSGAARERPYILLFLAVWILLWLQLWRKVRPLADLVYDCGDLLLIERGGSEFAVPFSQIASITDETYLNQTRIFLTLTTPGQLGTEISFVPIIKPWFGLFSRNKIAADLARRIDIAKSQSVA